MGYEVHKQRVEVSAHAVHKAQEQVDLREREKRGEEGERGLAGGTHKWMVPLKRRKCGTYICKASRVTTWA
jgi:hypothetical protein